MQTETIVYIRAPKERIFALGADICRWPEILPHYRSVDVLEQSDDGHRKVARMCAQWTADRTIAGRGRMPVGAELTFPVCWKSVQLCEPENMRIIYKHLAGAAVGMWVEWNLADDPWDRGVKVAITHRLRYPLQLLNGWFARDIVGHTFIEKIAGQTLATIKEIAEQGAGAQSDLEGQAE